MHIAMRNGHFATAAFLKERWVAADATWKTNAVRLLRKALTAEALPRAMWLKASSS